MQMRGEQRIAAGRERVWAALNDPEVLRQCIPGCQSLEKEGEDRFAAVAEVKIGPIGARFKGAVDLTELDPPNGYVLVGSGNGGIAGNAKGSARVRLREDAGNTLLSYDVDAQVGGRMAQLGGPIIDATAKQLAGKFFAKFGEIVGDRPASNVPPAATSAAPATAVGEPAPLAAALPAAASSPVPYAEPAPQVRLSFPWAWAIAVALAVIGGFLLGRSPADDVWAVVMVIVVVVTAGAGFEAGRRGGRP